MSLGALGLYQRATLRVNGARLNRRLHELAQFGRTPEGGISRVAYSDADREGRDYAMGLMREAGLDVQIDFAGNILGRRRGTDPNLPPLMFGSHIDSVPHGGNYDGQVGSIGAIEVAQTLADASLQTRHPLEVVIFQNEERGATGSLALAVEVTEDELSLPTHSGKSIGEGIAFLGGDPAKLDAVRRHPGDIACYLELHIEQGAILHQKHIDIGVVEGIVGVKRWNVTVTGFANHAGTTPMDQRRDAMLTAGRFIDLVNQIVTSIPGRQVGTVGRLEAHPGAANVIPGRTMLSLEIRDLEMAKIDRVFQEIKKGGTALATTNHTRIEFELYDVSRAAPTDVRLRKLIDESATRLELSTLWMPSGAGHDAQTIARLAPVGMIFIPSVDGISHSPKEFSRPSDIEAGTNVLLHTLLGADVLELGG